MSLFRREIFGMIAWHRHELEMALATAASARRKAECCAHSAQAGWLFMAAGCDLDASQHRQRITALERSLAEAERDPAQTVLEYRREMLQRIAQDQGAYGRQRQAA
jgi:hypothetical protein